MKKKVLIISLLALSGALKGSDTPTPQYKFSGEEAVANLIRNGECRDCDLSNQDLRAAMATVNRKYRKRCMYTDLSWANLFGANLSGVDLSCATMRETSLACANLTGANLSNTIMTDANLTGADLTNANLFGAIMTNVNLTSAIMTNANMRRVAGLDSAIGYTSTK
jgi:uncharacterized protein YjbI with pentapeptide repeats